MQVYEFPVRLIPTWLDIAVLCIWTRIIALCALIPLWMCSLSVVGSLCSSGCPLRSVRVVYVCEAVSVRFDFDVG